MKNERTEINAKAEVLPNKKEFSKYFLGFTVGDSKLSLLEGTGYNSVS